MKMIGDINIKLILLCSLNNLMMFSTLDKNNRVLPNKGIDKFKKRSNQLKL